MAVLGPNAFAEARIKLFRAYEHIVALRDFLADYTKQATYQVKRDYVRTDDETLIKVAIDPLPANLAVIVGDAIANLWHAYNCLWNAMVRGAGQKPGQFPFPIAESPQEVRQMLQRAGVSALPGVEALFEETIRPHGGATGNRYIPLFSSLERINRERLLLIEPGLVQMGAARWQGNTGSISTPPTEPAGQEGNIFFFPALRGDVLPVSEPEVQFQIVFGGLPGGQAIPVVGELGQAAAHTGAIIDACEDLLVGQRSHDRAPGGRASAAQGSDITKSSDGS